MKIEIIVSSKILYDKLRAVGKVVSSKTTLPELSCFLFEVWNHQLFVTGSDLETTIKTSIVTEQVPAEGKFLLEHKLLIDGLKELPEQPIKITTDTDSRVVTIKHEKGVYKLVGMDPESYPLSKSTDELSPAKISMDGSDLTKGIKTVLPYAANDELRPILSSVFIECIGKKLIFAASNANYLAVLEKNVDFEDFSLILSSKSSKIISDLCDHDQEVSVILTEKKAILNFGDYEIHSRLVEGRYPTYQSVIPKNNDKEIRIDRIELVESLRRATIFTNHRSSLIVLNTGSDELGISGSDTDLNISAEESIRYEYSGEPVKIGFKADFILQCLSTIETQEVLIQMSETSRPALFLPVGEDQGIKLIVLLMPMMINT